MILWPESGKHETTAFSLVIISGMIMTLAIIFTFISPAEINTYLSAVFQGQERSTATRVEKVVSVRPMPFYEVAAYEEGMVYSFVPYIPHALIEIPREPAAIVEPPPKAKPRPKKEVVKKPEKAPPAPAARPATITIRFNDELVKTIQYDPADTDETGKFKIDLSK